MPEKKLLHILYSGQGGLGTYFMNFVNSDHENHFKHHAFFYGIEPLNKELEDFCTAQEIPYQYVKRSVKIDLKAVNAVLKFCREFQIQYLLLHTFSLSLLTLLIFFKKWKLVALDHTPYQVKTKIEWLFSLINHIFAYKMIYFYEGHFGPIKKKFPFIFFGKNSHILPKNVNVDFFKPAANLTENMIFTMGTTARLIQGKRHDLIIHAIKQLKEDGTIVNLKVAGTGPLSNPLKELVDSFDLGEQVHFTGLLSRQELVRFYQSLDAYFHASDGETICYSIMEAQACGLPIMASDVEGINNHINNSSQGILLENTVKSIVENIKILKDDPKLIHKLSENSRRQIFDLASLYNNSKQLNDLLESS